MTNDNYKKALSGVGPSSDAVERLYGISEERREKSLTGIKKLLIVIAAVISTFTAVSGVFSATTAEDMLRTEPVCAQRERPESAPCYESEFNGAVIIYDGKTSKAVYCISEAIGDRDEESALVSMVIRASIVSENEDLRQTEDIPVKERVFYIVPNEKDTNRKAKTEDTELIIISGAVCKPGE